MPTHDAKGVSLHYEVSGEGPPLLLLAGMMSDSATWLPILPLLEPNFTIIRPDNRTTGRTRHAASDVSVTQMADDAAELMESLGHQRYHIAGHSMGGLMGMEIAGTREANVLSLTILASGPVRIARSMAMFDSLLRIRRTQPDGEKLWLRALYPWIFGPEFFADRSNVEIALQAALAYPHAQSVDAMEVQIGALATFNPRVRVEDLRAKTQAVFAEHDILIPNAAARQAFAKNPSIELHEIPDAGHSIVWDAPEEVAERISRFAT